MRIDFVSLAEVIDRTAPRVDVSQDEVDRYSDLPTDGGDLDLKLARYPARQIFQRSRAAVKILKCVFDTPATVRWYDRSLPGDPLHSEEVRKEIWNELRHIAKMEQQFKRDVIGRRGLSPRWRNDTSHVDSNALPALNLWPRLHDVGFDKAELLLLFSKQGILHNFGAFSSLEEARTSRPVKNEWPPFRGEMAPILDMVVRKVEDPSNPLVVWQALKMLALGENPPYPICKYKNDKTGIEIFQNSNKTGTQYYTKKQLTRSLKDFYGSHKVHKRT